MAESLDRFLQDLMLAWNSHDIDQAVKFYAANYAGEDVARAVRHQGQAGIRQFIVSYLTAFPDLEFSADETISNGEQAALMWTARGTHRGAIMNIPPTNRPIVIRGVSLLTIKANLVHRATYIWDLAGLLREIGLLPEL